MQNGCRNKENLKPSQNMKWKRHQSSKNRTTEGVILRFWHFDVFLFAATFRTFVIWDANPGTGTHELLTKIFDEYSRCLLGGHVLSKVASSYFFPWYQGLELRPNEHEDNKLKCSDKSDI